jgi:hypothetical protein
MRDMANLTKLTTVVIVDSIEAQLGSWEALGYHVVTRVPDSGPAGFVILDGGPAELMLQTRASVEEDLPVLAGRPQSALLYAHVPSLTAAKRALSSAKVLIEQRKTFYGATESWLELPSGTILGLAER